MNAKNVDTSIRVVAVVGILVAVNIIGVGLFGRLDLTRDQQFTLSAGTTTTLSRLDDPVTVRAYFSKDLPPPYASNARYVRDLLEEYYAKGKGNFRFEFIDPVGEETEADKEKKKEVKRDLFGRQVREETSVEKDLRGLGIPSVQVRVNAGDKLEVKRAYMGLVVGYGDKKEAIPVVQDTNGLEYDITTLIRKMSRPTPKIALGISGEGMAEELRKSYGRVIGLLGQLFAVSTIDFGQEGAAIPEGTAAVALISPRQTLSAKAKATIDAYLMQGGAAAFLLDTAIADTQTLQVEKVDHGLTDLLARYGVTYQDALVLDAECATINIQEQRGFMRISHPVKYPFVLVPKTLERESKLTRGLTGVALPFMAPLAIALPQDSGVKAGVVVRSSERSWVERGTYNIDPRQRWTPTISDDEKGRPVVVTLEGPIRSFAAASAAEAASESGEAGGAVANNARVLVAGGSLFASDQFYSPANEALVLNLFDWLVMDEALLAMRTRGLSAAPLEDISDGKRQALKYFNIAGLPAAFVVLGLLRWMRRQTRRKNIVL